MQRINVRREELYELVWSKPRTTIAKELGISDVRVGKLCRDMNVPAPPRGYWANKDGKRKRRKFEKPPLTYTVAERIQADHEAFSATRPSFNPKNFDEPFPPAPVIPYSHDEAIARYRTLVARTPIPHATRGVHPVTQKFMAEDERLAKLARTSSWYQPKFTSTEGKQLLDGINRLLWFFQDLGFEPHARGQRHIVLWLRGAYGSNFEVAAIQSVSAIGIFEPLRDRHIRATCGSA